MRTYTINEIKYLVAPLTGMPAEDIDDFIIVIRGKCPDCGGHNSFQLYHSVDSEGALFDIMAGGVLCYREGEPIPDE